MKIFIELLKFVGYSALVVAISKYILVKALRVLAESLRLKPKLVGEISGFATSVPELLTVLATSISGLIGAGIYNILSSNVINLVQYWASVVLNKNTKALKKKAIRIDLLLVFITIAIPALMLLFGLQSDVIMTPFLFALFFLFYIVSNRFHKRYSENVNEEPEQEIFDNETDADKKVPGNKALNITLSVGAILLSGVALYLICIFLGNTLTTLAYIFRISELVLGAVLGFITSIPELITFFEAQQYYKNAKDRSHGVVEATSNLLMSNIVNLFFILALGTLIYYFTAQ